MFQEDGLPWGGPCRSGAPAGAPRAARITWYPGCMQLGWQHWGLGVRCQVPLGRRRALPPSGQEGTVWLCSCRRPHGCAPASPGCWRCGMSLGVPGTAAALEQRGALAPKQGRRRRTRWQPRECQGWGGDAEGTRTAPLHTSPGSHGGGGASPSCTGGHMVPGRGTGGVCLASTAVFPGRSSGAAVL